MNKYTTLPSLSTIVGTFSFTLWSEYAPAVLTIPTAQTVLEIGETEEIADVKMGIAQTSVLRMKLRDDYTTHSEGFWYKVLNGDMNLRIYLNQDGIDTFYFFGKVQPETVEWEHSYIGSTRIRTVTFELISGEAVIFDTPTATWVDEVMLHDVATGVTNAGDPSMIIKVKGLFASMLTASGLNLTYNLADVSYVWNGGPDFKYTIGATEYNFDDLYIKTETKGTPDAIAPYFNHDPATRLEKYYSTLRAMIGDLQRNFGLVIKMEYDVVNEKHLIKLIQRGRAFSPTLDFSGKEKSSIIKKSTSLVGDAVRATLLNDSTKFCWFSKKYSDAATITDAPNYVEFDVDSKAIFVIASGYGSDLLIWDGIPGSVPQSITGVKYYNYNSGIDYVTTQTGKLMQEAIAGYIYYRFTNVYTSIINRYGGFRANDGTTNNHTILSILRRTSINDGIAAANYYANKITKFPMESEFEIEWIKE